MGYGFHLPFDHVPLHAMRPQISELRRLGYTDVWTAESGGHDALTPLTMAATWEPSLHTGAAILGAYTRGPAVLAMTAAAMSDACPGGFTIGIGASSKPIVQRWNGIAYEHPFERVRDTVRFLQRALNGERVQQAFPSFTIDGFRLEQPPQQRPDILIAALRPQMLRLAGTEADGAILNLLSPRDLLMSAREVGPDRRLVTKILVCLEPDETVFLPFARRTIASYLTVDAYAAYHRWLGREETLAPVWEAWAAGDRAAAAELVPDRVVTDLIVFGSADECYAGIARYVDAGATTPVLCPLPGGTNGVEFIRALAP